MANPRMFDDLIDAASQFANDGSPLDRAMPSPGRAAMPPLAPAAPAGMFDDLLPSPLDRAMPGVPGAARTQSGGMPWLEYIDNLGRQGASGIALGVPDEASAGLNALLGTSFGTGDTFGKGVQHKPGATMGERYDADLAFNRERDKAFLAQYPIAGTAANVAGAIGGTYGPLKALGLLKPAAGFWGNVGKNMAAGALVGGPAGFLGAEGGFDKRLVAGEIGAGLGAGVGAAAVPVMSLAGAVGRFAAESKPGRAVGGAIGSGLNKAADVVEGFAPKVPPPSLSAGGVPGGPGIPVDGAATTVADMLRNRAAGLTGIPEQGAINRIADALRAQGMTAEDAAKRLAQLGPGASLADLGPATMRITRNAKEVSPASMTIIEGNYGPRASKVGPRVVTALEGDIPPPVGADIKAYLVARKPVVGSEIYDPLRRTGVEFSPEMNALSNNVPDIATVQNALRARYQAAGKEIGTFDLAHKTTRTLRAKDDAAMAPGADPMGAATVDRDLTAGTVNDWRNALYRAAPEVREADRRFAREVGQPNDAYKLGRDVFRTGQGEAAQNVHPGALARTLPDYSPEAMTVLRAKTIDTGRDMASAGTPAARRFIGQLDARDPLQPGNQILMDKLTAILGPEHAARIARQSAAERVFANTENTVLGGSKTADALFDASNAAGMPNIPTTQSGVVASIVDALSRKVTAARAGSEPVRQQTARMATSTDALMNEQTLEKIAAILARMQGLGSTITPAAAPLYGAVGSEFGPRY